MRTLLAILALFASAAVFSGCGSDCGTNTCYSAAPARYVTPTRSVVYTEPAPPPAPVVRPAVAPLPPAPATSYCNPCAGI